ncbi:MAG: hypothetical protein ACYC3S_04880 [Chloroflexota bacterium]
MSEEEQKQREEKPGENEDAWEEVGQQFRSLGNSLASAFRTAWKDEKNQQRLREVQESMTDMANHVGSAIHEAAESPEGQRARDEAAKAADAVRNAGQETAREVAPPLLSALRQVNAELKRVLDPNAPAEPHVDVKPADLPKVDPDREGQS